MIKKIHIVISTLILACCAHSSPTNTVPAQAVVSKFMQDAMHTQLSDGVNDWCEWHDAVTFKIISPPEWRGTNLVVYFPTDTTTNSLRHSVGKTFSFRIEKEYLSAPSNVEVHDGALQKLKKIDDKSNQELKATDKSAP